MAASSVQQTAAAHVARPWVLAWFTISSLVVLWDAAYIFSRPHSFQGGKWHWIWSPYSLYQNIDYVYGIPSFERHSGFPAAQSAMNVVESAMNLIYVTLHRSKPVEALLLGLCAIVMTLAKTILYWLNEYFSGFDSIGHNDAQTLLIYWIIPNGIWLVVPSLILRLFARDVVQGLKTGQNIGKKYQ